MVAVTAICKRERQHPRLRHANSTSGAAYAAALSRTYALTCIGVSCLQPTTTESTVLIHGAARSNAQCKHTQWIHDRVALEALTRQVATARGAPIHETILSRTSDSGDCLLLEGLITNFFVGTYIQTHTYVSWSVVLVILTLCYLMTGQ